MDSLRKKSSWHRWLFGHAMDGATSSSSPKRRHIQTSRRWKQQLEKLATMDDCEVVAKVGDFVFGKNKDFLIGTGSNGTEVFLGLAGDGTEVAVKKTINLKALENERELLELPGLHHPSIVRYVDYKEDKIYGYLALQLCEFHLEEYMRERKPSEEERKQLAKQVLVGLRVLHDHNLLHRDIKPQNVFIDTQGKARLADFGISRQLAKGQTTRHTSAVGTTSWMAKETLEPGGLVPYTRSSDIQVAGMLIYYILSGGQHPFGSGVRCETNIYDGFYNLDHVQDEAKHLVEKMINEDPKKRPTVEECLADPFWSTERQAQGATSSQPYTKRQCILNTLEDLSLEDLKRFQWYLRQPDQVEGLRVIPRSLLENAGRMETTDLIVNFYPGSEAQIMRNILTKIKRSDLGERYLGERYKNLHLSKGPRSRDGFGNSKDPSQHQESSMEQRILNTLEDLAEDEFMTFKWYLSRPDQVEGLRGIPKSVLENAGRTRTTDLIVIFYPGSEAQIMVDILTKFGRDDLVERFTNISKGASATQQHPTQIITGAENRLKTARKAFIQRISDKTLIFLMDELLDEDIITDEEMETAMAERLTDNKARHIIDMVRKKGNKASSFMIEVINKLDPNLCDMLQLKPPPTD